MTTTFLSAGQTTAFAALLLALSGSVHADDQDETTLNQVVELNKKALAQYESLDMQGAAALLQQALKLCQHQQLAHHPAAARTHIHLGVVYVSGLKHREQGLAEFRRALAIDPKITITKSLINPEVEAAFAEAHAATSPPARGIRALPFPTGQEARTQDESPQALDSEINHPAVTEALHNSRAGRSAGLAVGWFL